MNVQQIRQRIFDQLDYFPDLQQYRDSIVRRINDRYQEVNDTAHWLFLQKEVNLQLRKTVSGSSAVGGAAVYPKAGVGANARQLVAVNFTPTIEMEGQILTDGNGNEFVIIRVLIDVSNVKYIFVEPVENGLATGYNTAFTVSDPDTGFTITFSRSPLPSDCIEVLGITDRDDDRGRLLMIDRKREEVAYLDRDNTGEPSVAIDDDFVLDPSPRKAPTVATSGSSGDLAPNTTYAYKYTILREGRESPPSAEVQLSTGTGVALALSNLDDLQWRNSSGSLFDSGVAKLLYRRDVTNDSAWMLIKVLESSATTFTDDKLTPITIGTYSYDTNHYYSSDEDIIYYNDPGPYQFLRFWYVPDTDRKLVIRYHRRPRDLSGEHDVPEWPRHYHQLLIYLVLEDVFLQLQETTQSQLYARRGQQLLEQMRRRFLSRDDVRKKFARWDTPRQFRNIYGTPTIS